MTQSALIAELVEALRKIVRADTKIAGTTSEDAFEYLGHAAMALSHAALADEWQPIETAPKDGTAILVSSSEGITTAFWLGTYWHIIIAGSYAEDDEIEPTHWRPLPPPPAEKEGE